VKLYFFKITHQWR